MDPGAGELAEVQQDLACVKKALRDGTEYLGMKGENLTRYLLQLNEKENLLYSKQLRHMSLGADDSASPRANGFGAGRGSMVKVPQAPAKEPPPGPPKAFNRDNAVEVITHMIEYEAVPQECAKALKALSSQAYSDAGRVGGDSRVLPQLLRLLALHPNEGLIKIGSMRVLCNMAYDQGVAVNKLTDPGILSALVAAVAESDPKDKSKGGEASAKAGEALARIVAAEVNPEGNGNTPRPSGSSGPLVSLFLAAASGEASWQETIPNLVKQLVANEVCEARAIAERFSLAGSGAARDPNVAIGWMSLAKLLAAMEHIAGLPQALVDTGSIRSATEIMSALAGEAPVQLAGVEAMSALVGNRWAGLQAFAEVGGMKRIEAALSAHGEHAVLQTKGIRALASGIQWPEDVQKKACYDARTAIEVTMAAMSRHAEELDLLLAGLEALTKYLDKYPASKEQVVGAGGEALVKKVMTTFREKPTVQQVGRQVLTKVGADASWQPPAAGA